MGTDLLKISLEKVAGYILRDPSSWEGISLFYACRQNEEENQSLKISLGQSVSETPGALLFEKQNQSYILLGARNAPNIDTSLLSHCLWAENIATAQESIHKALDKVAANRKAPPRKSPPHSILVVEDEPLLNKIMIHHLKQFGSVIATSNYREAVANYMVQNPHVVFLDISYNGDDMNGLDALKNMLIYDSEAFIIMVSADDRIETRLEAFASGAQGFIAKPFRTTDFTHYLTKLGLGT